MVAQKTMSNVKIATNIPEIMRFKFNSWKKWENIGKDGKYATYSIGVENRGQDAYFSVYEKEYNNIFSKLGNLQNRTLEILKYEDGKYKKWKVLENGQDITPQWGAGTSPQPTQAPQTSFQPQTTPTQPNSSTPSGQFLTINQFNEQMDKMRGAFRTMQAEIDALKKQVGAHGTLLVDVRGKEAVDFHEATEPKKESPLGDEYNNIEII